MPRSIHPAINDMLETIERVQGKVAGKRLAEFSGDWELRFIVERAIESISEATRRLPDALKAGQPQIPWRSVAGVGNILRHEYRTSPTR